MSYENAGQVLRQIQDPLRGPLSVSDSGLLAFQLLVWAHLSAKGQLDQVNTAEAALPFGAAGVVEALGRLAMAEGLVGQAFGDAPRRAQFSGDFIVSAVTIAKRLAEGGIFDRYSPADVSAELLPSTAEPASVSAAVAKLMVDLVVAGVGQGSIYCPWEVSGQFVGELLNRPEKLYIETPYSTPLPALLSLFRMALTEIVLTDPLRSSMAISGGVPLKFDATIAIPPFNVTVPDSVVETDLYGRFPVKRATGNGLNVQHVVAHTNGKAALIVPNSFVFGPGRDREVRENLLKKGWLQAVIALPRGILSSTSIPSTLLLLDTRTSRRNVGLVDASQQHFVRALGRGQVTLENTDAIVVFCAALDELELPNFSELDSSNMAVVGVDEILANDSSLQVDRYVIGEEQRVMQAALDSRQTEALEDVVKILNPIPNKDRGADTPDAIEVCEVGAVDLPPFGYIDWPEKTVRVRLSSRRSGMSDDAFLRPYDLVLIVKGSTGKIGIVPGHVPAPGPGGWIAGQSAVVLRARDPSLDLRGLGLWLRSKMGQQLLGSIKSGASIPMLSIATLRQLRVIALIPQWTQMAIDVLEGEAELQGQIDVLRDQQASIAEDLWAAILQLK
jgi:type I restriction enzyme M protein